MALAPINPVRPVAPWIGGKRNLAKRVIARLSEFGEHVTYVEPFVGMGGIFFRRTVRPRAEVINDYSGDVANLFRILQRHYVPFMDTIRWSLTTRDAFERLSRVDPTTLTDLERAARFLYLQRVTFGGKVEGRTFGVSRGTPARFDLEKLAPMLEDVHSRLSGVTVEQLDFEELIIRYDAPETLFYLDPPYWGTEGFYGRDLFRRADFERLNGALKDVRGRFVMTLNDCTEVRALFGWCEIEAVQTTYTAAQKTAKTAGELLISSPP